MGDSAASIAIAGGGIIGLSTAWRLGQFGFRVSVFDQRVMGGEASWAGAGMLAPGGEIDEPSELASWALEARRLYPAFIRELRAESGLAIDFQEVGALDLAYSSNELDALEGRAARQLSMGIESEAVTPRHVGSGWPGVRTAGLVGARFYPGDGFVNPRDVLIALCAVCRKLGVRLVQNCAVLQVSDKTEGTEIVTSHEVETHNAVLIAAGAWSSGITVDGARIPEASPVKGHLIGYQQPAHTCNTIIRHGHTYLLQRASGLLIAGASVEYVGFDRQIDTAIVAQLRNSASFIMPHLLETTPTEIWVGFRPASGQVRVGRWKTGNVYLAYGHYRNGILLAPETACRLVTEISANWGTR